MAITSAAGSGLEVTTAAVDEVLATQAQANGTNQIVISDTLATLENGQAIDPTDYVNRMCILRQGAGNEETRLIIAEAAGTGTTRILTVNEDWVAAPAVSDQVHFSYSSDDMAAISGMTLSSKTGVYEGASQREWAIGQGTNFAYVAVFDFQGWEIPDRAATEAGLEVLNNGRLDFGYIQAGAPIQGAIVTAIQSATGELGIEIAAGGIFRVYSTIFRSWLAPITFDVRATADVIMSSVTIKDFTNDALLFAGTYTDISIAGGSSAAELVRLAEETVINGVILAAFSGLTTEASDTSAETITVRDPTFVAVSPLIIIEANKTWDIVNPVWTVDETDQSDLNFSNSTANGVNERYSLDPVVQDGTGTKISGARVFVYEGLRLGDLVVELTTDADGLAPGNWVFKNFTEDGASTLTVLTDGDHAIRIDNYGDFPFIAAQVSSEKFAGAVVLNPDPTIAQSVQATAISAGSGATFNTDANPSELFDFTAGASTLGVGETLTFSPSGATGIVTEITSGDDTAGTVHLSDRNGTAIADNDTIASSVTWTGTYTNGTSQQFSRWIDGNGLSLQTLHDYFAARTAEASGGFTAEAEIIHEWGNELEQRVMYLGVDGWFTNRSGTEGVFISDFGAGTVDFFTADDGTTFVPPTTTTVTFTGMKDNSEVRVYLTGTSTEIAGIENVVDGSLDNRTFAWSALATTDVDYVIHNWLAGVPVYETIRVNNFIVPAANTSIGIQQRLDRNAV